jgi:hypothetical protein
VAGAFGGRATGRDVRAGGPQGRQAPAGAVEIDYYQLFGCYRGVLRSQDGTAYGLNAVHGVLESFKARL